MPKFSQQITDICRYATLAVHDSELYGKFYKKYTHLFEDLLNTITPADNPELRQSIHEIVTAIYSVHEMMLDDPEQDQIQTEKLQNYIEYLIARVQADSNYIKNWTMQSILDELFTIKRLKKSHETEEELIENSTLELESMLEEMLMLEKQKSDLLTENDIDDPEDDDNLSQEMDAVLHFPLEDRQAMSPVSSDEYKSDTTTVADDKSTNRSSPTNSFDSETSEQNNLSETLFVELAEKFHKIMANFQAQIYPDHLKNRDKKILENMNDKIARNMMDLYKHCFQKGITPEALTEFATASQSMIANSSHWKEKDMSANASPYIAQPLAKLTIGLHKLMDEMHESYHLAEDVQESSDNRNKLK